MVAGVCTGLARATNTDPLLYRILFAALALFAGVGILLYLLAWLLLPEDGEDAPPLLALLTHARSHTGAASTVALGLIALVLIIITLRVSSISLVLGLAAITGAVLLIRRERDTSSTATTTTTAAAAHAPSAPDAFPQQRQPSSAGPSERITAAPAVETMPFAPHGPYSGPPPTTPPLSPRDKRRIQRVHRQRRKWENKRLRRRTPLARITIAIALLGMAGLLAASLMGADFPLALYPAVALAVTAAGLIVGTWVGNGRALIGFGMALVFLLSICTAADRYLLPWHGAQAVTWQPHAPAALQHDYRTGVGQATLDLRTLDLNGLHRTVTIKQDVGELDVWLPPSTDVHVIAHVDAGSLQILGQTSGGLDVSVQQLATGESNFAERLHPTEERGKLTMYLKLGVGNVEVKR